MTYDCPAEWDLGAGPIYERLSLAGIRSAPLSLSGRVILDIGAGTGSTSKAILASHGWPIAVDLSLPMLAHAHDLRPPAVVGDATRLPLVDSALGGVVAAFCISHLDEPEALLAEASRVVETGGPVLVIVFADSSSRHPVSEAVATAAAHLGWVQPEWYRQLKEELEPAISDTDRLRSLGTGAGLAQVQVNDAEVDFTDLGPHELIAWRLGGPALAPFVAQLAPEQQEWLTTEAARALGDEPSSLLLRIRTMSGSSS